MKKSKRIERIINKLDKIEKNLEYFTNGNRIFRKDFQELRDTIEELSLEKKVDHARFAKKLKGLWERSEDSD